MCERPTNSTFNYQWLISNIIYYSNSVASFNFLGLTILLSGDVHPMPGPVNATTGRMIPVLTRHRKPNQSTMHARNPAYFTNVTIM